MVAYSYRMPAGIPGEVNRVASALIEAQVVSSAAAEVPLVYGIAMIVGNTAGNVGNMRILTTGDTNVYGMLVRPFPTNSGQDGLGTSTPPKSGIIDILKRGYMSVYLQGATAAAKGGQVYAYLNTTDTSHLYFGGIEAATSTNAIAIPNTYFMGPADTSSIVEIGYNI